MTFSSVNEMKGRRTAMQFIEDDGGKPVPGAPNLSLLTAAEYRDLVGKLDTRKGHSDDQRRKKRRKEWLLLKDYEEKEFTVGDLTKTSQLVRLGAGVISRFFESCKKRPRVISLPGAVTGTVRKAWNVTGCLAQANPSVLDDEGNTKTKTEIRGITHLHHALDACVIGLASHFIPNQGRVWELIVKRNHSPTEREELARLEIFAFDSDRRFRLRDLSTELKQQICERLAECRVFQHVPSKLSGLRVEQNTWRVLSAEGGKTELRQRLRKDDGALTEDKIQRENPIKLLGIDPRGEGKLKNLKGALVISCNFGVALDPMPTIIPFHKVWPRIREIGKENGGKNPRILRNGMLVSVLSGAGVGVWRVLSIKNTTRDGITIAVAKPDRLRQDRVLSLKGMLAGGMKILDCSMVGMSIRNQDRKN